MEEQSVLFSCAQTLSLGNGTGQSGAVFMEDNALQAQGAESVGSGAGFWLCQVVKRSLHTCC